MEQWLFNDKLYMYGGNHECYLGDLHIPWDNKLLLSIGGHTKEPSESMPVKVFDLHTCTWSILKTYGKRPEIYAPTFHVEGLILNIACNRQLGKWISGLQCILDVKTPAHSL